MDDLEEIGPWTIEPFPSFEGNNNNWSFTEYFEWIFSPNYPQLPPFFCNVPSKHENIFIKNKTVLLSTSIAYHTTLTVIFVDEIWFLICYSLETNNSSERWVLAIALELTGCCPLFFNLMDRFFGVKILSFLHDGTLSWHERVIERLKFKLDTVFLYIIERWIWDGGGGMGES